MNSETRTMGQSNQLRGLLLMLVLAGMVWEISSWIITGDTQNILLAA